MCELNIMNWAAILDLQYIHKTSKRTWQGRQKHIKGDPKKLLPFCQCSAA